MREIVLDTETTGLSPADGHRVVELACVELMNHIPTGRHFQTYINPERPMPAEAFAVHGLGDEFLKDQPRFADIAEKFLEFIGDDVLVIHNAEFDMRFLNAELERLGRPVLSFARARDTVRMARQKFPGTPASLDALCRRFDIDNSSRTVHGALLDAELLAEVYLALLGGRQAALGLAAEIRVSAPVGPALANGVPNVPDRMPRVTIVSAIELAVHEQFLEKLKDPLWRILAGAGTAEKD